jgi:hypothetical protein
VNFIVHFIVSAACAAGAAVAANGISSNAIRSAFLFTTSSFFEPLKYCA